MSAPAQSSARQKLDFCATFSARSGEEPAGSAWAVHRHLLVELALPWPEYYIRARSAPPGAEALMEQVYADLHWSKVPGIIAIAPDPDYAIPGKVRLFYYDPPANQESGTYRAAAYAVDPDGLLDAIKTFIYEPESQELEAIRIEHDPRTRDLLVCTHGTVDACCASLGAPIYKLMRAMADQAATPTRVWRCTHFGGHRFAPTALDLPTGHYWGRLDAQMLSGLIHRTRDAENYRPHYRGSTSLEHPLWQRAEAELFAAAGWAWFDARGIGVDGALTEESGGDVTFAFNHPEAGSGSATVRLTANGAIETREASGSAETTLAPQYLAEIIAQDPPDILERIRGYVYAGPA